LPEERRETIRLYAGHLPFVTCELLGDGFRMMTLLRDPIDRTVSLLRQVQRFEASATGSDRAGAIAPARSRSKKSTNYLTCTSRSCTTIRRRCSR
jgi:hypothetical protein